MQRDSFHQSHLRSSRGALEPNQALHLRIGVIPLLRITRSGIAPKLPKLSALTPKKYDNRGYRVHLGWRFGDQLYFPSSLLLPLDRDRDAWYRRRTSQPVNRRLSRYMR